VNYIIDALSAIETSDVELALSDPNSSCLMQPKDNQNCKYVIMPMRL
jgi:DNA polymerase-3 subunit beta